MPLLCKQRALYVKGCIIANGIMDSQGDTLYSEDIKKIFTSFNNQDNFEVYHNDIPIEEVSLLENYISVADETIGTAIVPSGSWNCVIRVDNPEIQQGLLNGEFGGLSLNNRIAPKCKGNLSGTVRYKDVADAECVIPLLISFVNRGANGYGLHVYDYDTYIKKSDSIRTKKNGAKNMAFDLLGGLKSLIKQAEASENEDPVILKEDEEPQTEPVVEEPVNEEAESTEEPAAEPVADEPEDEATNNDDEETETTEEDPSIKKADEEETDEAETETTPEEEEEVVVEEEAEITKDDDPNLEERVAKLEELVAKLTKADEEEDEVVEEEAVEEDETETDTPKITKSEKVIVEDNNTVQQANYFEMSGRDPLTGKKIRK